MPEANPLTLFLDTTVQVDRVCSPDWYRQKIEDAIKSHRCTTSDYVLMEFKRTLVCDARLGHSIVATSPTPWHAIQRLAVKLLDDPVVRANPVLRERSLSRTPERSVALIAALIIEACGEAGALGSASYTEWAVTLRNEVELRLKVLVEGGLERRFHSRVEVRDIVHCPLAREPWFVGSIALPEAEIPGIQVPAHMGEMPAERHLRCTLATATCELATFIASHSALLEAMQAIVPRALACHLSRAVHEPQAATTRNECWAIGDCIITSMCKDTPGARLYSDDHHFDALCVATGIERFRTRGEERQAVRGEMTAQIGLPEKGTTRWVEASVRDWSQHGMRLRSPERPPEGTEVTVVLWPTAIGIGSPLLEQAGRVTWTRGDEFGVQLTGS